MNRFLPVLLGVTALTAVLPIDDAMAQGQEVSQLALQRPDAVNELNGHLARLAQDPRNVSALIGAGEAALGLDDPRAATGFFVRADAIESGNGRIKAGLGRALVGMRNTTEALKMFDQAARLGYPPASFVADRALAYDLSGNQTAAQQDYRTALQAKPGDEELIRHYAISLGISGDVEAAEAQLKPLLLKSDRGAWRDRAFILAMNNRRTDALAITDRTMPPALAQAIKPYMERMSLLTPAQRAAAVHFGIFPSDTAIRTAQLGPEAQAPVKAAPVEQKPIDPKAARKAKRAEEKRRKAELALAQRTRASRGVRVAEATPQTVQPVVAQAAQQDPRRVGARVGQRIGDTPTQTAAEADRAARAEEQRLREQREQQARTASTKPAPARTPVPTAPVRVAEATPQPVPAPSREVVTAPAPAAQQPSAATVQGPLASSAAVEPRSALVQGPPSPEPAATAPSAAASTTPSEAALARAEPTAPATPAPDPAATETLADIMRELRQASAERKESGIVAVDLSEVARLLGERRAKQQQTAAAKAKTAAALKAKAEADAKAKAEAAEKARIAKNPSRNWVQVGTGRDLSALGFTWKGLKKQYGSLAAKDAWTATWGRTNRLVVGPFPSFAKARDYEDQLKKGGADAFAWQSDAGEDVARLAGK